MERKKIAGADLEKKKGLILQISAVVVLAAVLLAFEWSTTESTIAKNQMITPLNLEVDIVPITRYDVPKPPVPKDNPALEIVDNQTKVVNTTLIDVEIDETEGISFIDEGNINIEPKTEDWETTPVTTVEDMPEFPGGEKALLNFVAKNTIYPEPAIENDIQGRVFIRFVVSKTGKIINATVLRSVHPLLDKEALRVVNSMPQWKPGYQNSKAVNVWYTIPITFKLSH